MKRRLKTTKQMTAFLTALAITSANLGGGAVIAKAESSTIDTETKKFKDVHDDHWAADYIYEFKNQGYIAGYTDETFKPTKLIIRAEVATILANVGIDEIYQEVLFTDIKDDVWYSDKVITTAKVGLMRGDGNGRFNPDEVLTRNEAFKIAAMTYPRVDVSHIEPNFVDQYTVPDWALEFEKTLIYYDVLHGFSDGTVRGNDQISRAEFVKLFGNLVDTDVRVISENVATWHDDTEKIKTDDKVVVEDKPIITDKESDYVDDNHSNPDPEVPREPVVPWVPLEPAQPILPDESEVEEPKVEEPEEETLFDVALASEITGNTLNIAPNKYRGNYPYYNASYGSTSDGKDVQTKLVIKDEIIINTKDNVKSILANGEEVYTQSDNTSVIIPVTENGTYTITITDINDEVTTQTIVIENVRDGSKEKPFAVVNEDDLKNIASTDKYYEQCSEIDLTSDNWEPIDEFNGYYYGNQMKISNLNIVSDEEIFLGLFREIQSNVTLSNVNLEIGTVELTTETRFSSDDSNFGFGGLVGYNKGVIEECVVTVPSNSQIINATKYVLSNIGGVVSNNEGTITETKVVVDGIISGGGTVGGIVANNYGDIVDCESEVNGMICGTIYDSVQPTYFGGYSIGGVAGKNFRNIINPTVNISGTIVGLAPVGGVVGGDSNYSLEDSFNITGAEVNISKSGGILGSGSIGGVVGEANASTGNTPTIKDCNVTVDGLLGSQVSDTSRGEFSGGIAGEAKALIENCDVTISGTIRGFGRSGGIVGKSIGQIKSCDVTITDQGKLIGTSYMGGIVGLNHYMDIGADEYSIEDCTVTIDGMIGMPDIYDTHGECLGGLAGYNSGGIKNSHVTLNGTMQGSYVAGGFIGNLINGEYSSEYTSEYAIIDNSVTINGDIFISEAAVGGFIGESYYGTWFRDDVIIKKNVINVTQEGTVKGTTSVGGLIGSISQMASNKDIELTNFIGDNVIQIDGEISGDENIGGFVGVLYRYQTKWTNFANITGSNTINIGSKGKISGNKNIGGYIGALFEKTYIGYSDDETNSPIEFGEVYIDGIITGYENVGGYIGLIEDESCIENIDVKINGFGEIKGVNNVALLIGKISDNVVISNIALTTNISDLDVFGENNSTIDGDIIINGEYMYRLGVLLSTLNELENLEVIPLTEVIIDSEALEVIEGEIKETIDEELEEVIDDEAEDVIEEDSEEVIDEQLEDVIDNDLEDAINEELEEIIEDEPQDVIDEESEEIIEIIA